MVTKLKSEMSLGMGLVVILGLSLCVGLGLV